MTRCLALSTQTMESQPRPLLVESLNRCSEEILLLEYLSTAGAHCDRSHSACWCDYLVLRHLFHLEPLLFSASCALARPSSLQPTPAFWRAAIATTHQALFPTRRFFSSVQKTQNRYRILETRSPQLLWCLPGWDKATNCPPDLIIVCEGRFRLRTPCGREGENEPDFLFLLSPTALWIHDHLVRGIEFPPSFLPKGTLPGLVCHVKWQMVSIGPNSLVPGSFSSKRRLFKTPFYNKLFFETTPARPAA